MNTAVTTPLSTSSYEDISSISTESVSDANRRLMTKGGLNNFQIYGLEEFALEKATDYRAMKLLNLINLRCDRSVLEEVVGHLKKYIEHQKSIEEIVPLLENGLNADSSNLPMTISLEFKAKHREYLDEALSSLDNLDKFAAAEDLQPPSDVANENARCILKEIVPSFPRFYGIAPWGEGVVAIRPDHTSVNIFCNADGAVSVFVNHSGEGMNEWHAQTLNNGTMKFIRKAMEESK